ncbi:MAG: hypothetical protein ACKVOG_12215 [Rhodoglobus sp.]
MVAQFLRLKLTLLVNSFRRSPAQLVGMIIALTYGLGVAAFITIGLVSLRLASTDISRTVVIVFGSIVVLAFLLLPLVFGVDDTIDPRRFALFGIETTRLSVALAISALVSIPSLLIVVFAVAQVFTWGAVPGAAALAVLAAVLIVVTCVLAARVSSAVASLALATRRVREATAIALVAVLALLAPLLAIMATIDWGSRGLPILRRIASVLTWTPLGAAWSIPADAADGRWGQVPVKIGIAVAFVLVLGVAWRWLVAQMLTTPHRESVERAHSGLGWFARMPATPAGAVAARSLTYWSRDARYRVGLAVIPVVPIVMLGALMIAGVPLPLLAWLPVPVMCLFLGWTVHNDVAHDSSAFWAHVSASLSGRADRWGRLAPALGIGVPLVLIGSLATSAISGNWNALPGFIGVSAIVLLFGLGVSSVISAAFPYPAVRPGDSPFAQPQAAGTTGSVVQSLSFTATVLSAAPVAFLAFLGETVSPTWHWAALGAGLVVGGGALVGGVFLGGRLVDRRAPELLAFTLQN